MKKINKKYTKMVIFVALIVFFTFVLFITIKFINKDNDTKKNNDINYNDLLFEVNMATDNNFQEKKELYHVLHIPIDILNDVEYNCYFNEDTKEYFIIVKKISKNKILELESYVKTEKKYNNHIKYGNNVNYMYIINSKEHTSTVEGIIRSYIY